MNLNLRWLTVLLLLALLATGGGMGYWWWSQQPQQLYRAAGKAYESGETARKNGDQVAAKQHYSAANEKLSVLLTKTPKSSKVLFLRFEVLNRLAEIFSAEGKKESNPDKIKDAEAKLSDAWKCARLAAEDPNNVQAQIAILQELFEADKLFEAIEFADNLLSSDIEKDVEVMQSKVVQNTVAAAHFLKGDAALKADPARPDDALRHVRACLAIGANTVENDKPRPPRWREVDLEARALLKKAQIAKKRPKGGPGGKDDSLEKLSALLPALMKRARVEMKEVGIPASGDQPQRPVLVNLTPTNLRGLLSVLQIGVEQSSTPAETEERAELTLDICDALLAAKVNVRYTVPEVNKELARLPKALETLPENARLSSDKRAEFSKRIERLTASALEANAEVQPATYLELARTARQENRLEAAENLAKDGLRLADQRALPESNPAVLDLHAEAAWIAFLRNDPPDADRHLAFFAKRKQSGLVHLTQGLAAARDGRLDVAERELDLARQDGLLAKAMHPDQGLACVYLNQGHFDKAIPFLERLAERFKQPETMTREEMAIADQFLSSPSGVTLELLRCRLALGNLDKAAALRELLKDKPEAIVADVLYINYYCAVSRFRRAAGKDKAADEAMNAARTELSGARAVHPDDASLAWEDAMVQLQQPAATPKEKAANTQRAEAVLRAFTGRSGSVAGQLLWIRWLRATNRDAQALEALDNSAKGATRSEDKEQIKNERNELMLMRNRSDEASRLVRSLQPARVQRPLDSVGIQPAEFDPSAPQTDSEVAEALSRRESRGLRFLRLGEAAQASGNFRQALQVYERAMRFHSVRDGTRDHLIECLTEWTAKDSQEPAAAEAARLLGEFPDDPALLLFCAEMERKFDRITTRNGMAATLTRLKEILRQRDGDAAHGSYLLARGWNDAGRPDCARHELDPTLAANPTHSQALSLATRLALDDEDWEIALRYVAALEKLQAEPIQTQAWKAAALEGKGRADRAKAIYAELVRLHSESPAGNRGLAALLERSKDYGEACRQAECWHNVTPEDEEAVQACIRLLTRANQIDRARQSADRLLAEGQKPARDRLAAAERDTGSTPLAEQTKEIRRLKNAVALKEMELMRRVSLGFLEGGDPVEAEAWGKRLHTLAERAPDVLSHDALTKTHVLLAAIYRTRGEREADAKKREKLMNEAITRLKQALALAPTDRQTGGVLARMLCQEQGEFQAACTTIDEVRKGRESHQLVSGDRLDLGFLDTVAFVYLSGQRYQDASNVLEEAIKRYDAEPLVFLQLGRATAGLKKPDLARNYLALSVQLAEKQAGKTHDPDRKTRLLRLAEEARQEQGKLKGTTDTKPRRVQPTRDA